MIPRRIVAVGTSAFFGTFDEERKGGYIGRLKKWHEEKNIDNEFYNLGISRDGVGETTAELLQRLVTEARARKPQLIFLTSGINDVRRIGSKESPCVTPLENFKENIHTMIASTKEIAQDVIFIGVYPIKEKKTNDNDYLLPDDVKEYALSVKNVCAEENIAYIDLYEDWEKSEYNDLLATDGVHANAKGYEKAYELIKKFLLERYS